MPRPAKFTKTQRDGRRVLTKGFRRIQCFVPADVVKKLKLICAMDEIPFSDAVGNALAQYVKRRKV